MKGRKLVLALVAVLCLMGTAWAAEKEIVFNLAVDPRTIDPALNNAVDGSNVIYNIFDSLVRIGFDDAPEAACAEKWDVSEDGMSWTFHLREGLKWSDGKPLTAEDFRYGFLRAIDPEVASPYSHLAFFIRNAEAFYNGKAKAEEVGIVAVDDRTFRIDLEYQNPLMLDHLSYHIFYPARKDVVEKDPRGWTSKPETIVSNGPFKLESWKHGEGGELTLVKDPNYWDAANVKVERVRMVFITDTNTALAAFKAGRVDYLNSLPAQMIPQLREKGEAVSVPTLGTAFCVFNVTKKPFDDRRVREAFTLAIDRTAIVEKVTLGGQKPANAFIPYVIPGVEAGKDFRSEGRSYLQTRANPEKAKVLLAEAGYPEGTGFPKVTYKYNGNPGNKAIAEVLQAMWKKNLGITVELVSEEWKVFIETRNKKDYDIARHADLVDFFDAASLLDLWITGGGENVTGYSNANYDRLMKDAAREMDRAKRIDFMHKAEDILMRDLPVAPLYYYSSNVMQSKRVKGIYLSPRNWVFFRGAEVVE